jgi:ABC-type oligopeptide transport system substrate-binding subunit
MINKQKQINMKKVFLSLFLLTGASLISMACTNFLVTKGASADGSTMVSYNADSHVLYGELYFTPAAFHKDVK